MADNKSAYAASASLTVTLASLASDASLIAGRSSVEIDNTSGLYLDRPVSGQIEVGTTPTTATTIEVWLVPKLSDSTYADTFDGTDKNVAVTSRGILMSYAVLLATIAVDSATTNRNYFFWSSVAGKIGTLPPKKYQLFFVHNTGANLNATGGNHVITETPEYVTTT
jgi:hypothetical protein